MSMTFATNAASNSAMNYLQRNSSAQASSIAKLSSGSRIVKASDDAASLAVGTKLKADVTALKQAGTNASQAASLLQIADGALSRIGDTLMRMKSLATQARSDVLSSTERGYLDAEYQQMIKQIDFITTSTKFNGETIVDGSMGANFAYGTAVGDANHVTFKATGAVSETDVFQLQYTADATTMTLNKMDGTDVVASQTVSVAPTADFKGGVSFDSIGVTVNFNNVNLVTTSFANDATTAGTVTTAGTASFQLGTSATADNVSVDIARSDTHATGLNLADTNILTIGTLDTEGARLANIRLDTAIETINGERAELGAMMSRIEKIGENIATTIENLDAARSVLMDVDVAEEMTKFTTNQVMTQAATAMLAQANQLPQNLMRLLQ